MDDIHGLVCCRQEVTTMCDEQLKFFTFQYMCSYMISFVSRDSNYISSTMVARRGLEHSVVILCTQIRWISTKNLENEYLPIPPGTLSGTLVSRKVYLFSFLHVSLSAFRSQSSPMLIPKRPRNH